MKILSLFDGMSCGQIALDRIDDFLFEDNGSSFDLQDYMLMIYPLTYD